MLGVYPLYSENLELIDCVMYYIVYLLVLLVCCMYWLYRLHLDVGTSGSLSN